MKDKIQAIMKEAMDLLSECTEQPPEVPFNLGIAWQALGTAADHATKKDDNN